MSEPTIKLDEDLREEMITKVERINIKTKNEETQTLLEHASDVDDHLDALSTYCEKYSAKEPELLSDLRKETIEVHKHAARMVSSHLQGRLFTTLAATTKAKNVLELGTFTGYSALCFAEGLNKDGKVITCEVDQLSASIAKKYFDLSEHGNKIDLRVMKANDLLDILRQQDDLFFDIVFIDADKKVYLDYLKNLIGDKGSRPLLSKDALIIVDNTLWKGLVLEHEADLKENAPDAKLYGDEARMRLLAKEMHLFNQAVANNSKLSPMIIPLRDGLTIIRYNE
jgi:predicted O-methyltransferase YrrM